MTTNIRSAIKRAVTDATSRVFAARNIRDAAGDLARAVAAAADPAIADAMEPVLEDVDRAHAALDAIGAPRVSEVTGETLTDTLISVLRATARARGDFALVDEIDKALRLHDEMWRREQLATAYNALPEFERRLTLAERIRWVVGGRPAVAASDLTAARELALARGDQSLLGAVNVASLPGHPEHQAGVVEVRRALAESRGGR